MRPKPVELEWHEIPGGGTPLLLLHEGLGCAAQWRDFPNKLRASTGRPVLTCSRWGYGDSPERPGPWPANFLEQEADALLEALTAKGLSRVALYGHSDGASIALLAASRDPRVTSLVLEAPHVFVEEKTVESIAQLRRDYPASRVQERLRRRHGAKTDALVSAWCDVWLSAEFRPWNIEAQLPAIRCPVLVLQGEEDEYGTWLQVESIHARVSGGCRAIGFPSAGHTVHRDAEARLIQSVTDFLAEVE